MSEGYCILVMLGVAIVFTIIALFYIARIATSGKKKDITLEDLVREYINEVANPAPDYRYRTVLRARLAEKIGMEDPEVSLRRWHGR